MLKPKLDQNQTLFSLNGLDSVRQWLDSIEIHNPKIAHLLCVLIPGHCPFERTVKVFEHTLFYIPPLCKLNPFYEQLVAIRFKSLSCLAGES